MTHRFDIALSTNGRAREELHGDIPNEEWAVLNTYLDRYDKLAATRLAAGGEVKFTLTLDAVNGMSATGTLPPADDVDAFVYRMRPFVLKDEATSFNRVCNILARRLKHPAVLAVIRRQKDIFAILDFQEQIRLSANGQVLNADETLMLWLNGMGEYHGDRDKEDTLREIHEPLALEAMRPFFVSMMMDKAKAVAGIADLIRPVVKRGDGSAGIRFDEVNLD